MLGPKEGSEIESLDSVEKDTTAKPSDVKRSCSKLWPLPGFGMICALLYASCYAINTLLVKLASELHPIQVSLYRTCTQFIILLPVLQYKSKEVDILGPKGLRIYLLLRGLTGSTAMIFLYLAVDLMSVGNAVTVAYVSTVMVPFMARVILKESLTVLDIIFAAVSLIGVVLIIQPTFLFPVAEGEESPANGIGVLFAFISAFLQATALICIRKLGPTYPALNVLYYSICGAVTTTVWLSIIQEWRLPCRRDLSFIFSFGIIGVIGQAFLSIALRHERANTVGVLKSTQIIIVYVLQIIILEDFPTVLSLIGAALIFASSAGIGIRKIVNEHKRKKSVDKRT